MYKVILEREYKRALKRADWLSSNLSAARAENKALWELLDAIEKEIEESNWLKLAEILIEAKAKLKAKGGGA